jgi:flagellar biosynthesis protein FlhA
MREKDAATEKDKAPEGVKEAAAAKDSVEELLKIEPLAVGVGIGLVNFVEGGANSPLLRRISAIRKQLAKDLGYVLPPVRVTDNLALKAREYSISLKGSEIGRYEMPAGCELAIPVGGTQKAIEGQKTLEPAFRMPAVWVPSSRAEQARSQGYTVVDPVSVLGTHLAETIRRHAYELFSRQEAKKLMDRVAVDNPRVVEDLVPKLLPLAGVQRVLQNLLRERVSIRDAVSILEALGEAAGTTRNPVLLTEYVRQTVRRQLAAPYLNTNGDLPAWFLDPSLEHLVEAAVEHGETNSHINLAPQAVRDLVARVTRAVGNPEVPTAVISSSGSRYFLRQLVELSVWNLFFLSHNEIPPGVRVQSLGVIG